MKIVVAPDKFKGSLPATKVAAAIAAGLRAGRPGAEVVTIGVADGGEGTVDAAVAAGIAAVYPLTDLEPDLERCRTEADRLLRRTGQMIARDRLAEVVTGA